MLHQNIPWMRKINNSVGKKECSVAYYENNFRISLSCDVKNLRKCHQDRRVRTMFDSILIFQPCRLIDARWRICMLMKSKIGRHLFVHLLVAGDIIRRTQHHSQFLMINSTLIHKSKHKSAMKRPFFPHSVRMSDSCISWKCGSSLLVETAIEWIEI